MTIDLGLNSHLIILGLLLSFAIAHSGLAALRPKGEKLIGPRLYRVLFALVSLPLAFILIVYFFNHRYDGVQLWQLQGLPAVKPVVWILSAISFLFQPPRNCRNPKAPSSPLRNWHHSHHPPPANGGTGDLVHCPHSVDWD
jgi:hypothetical protein